MSIGVREVRAAGREYLALATALLQRVRLTDPETGLWEAADVQWWWRTPSRSDSIDQAFWIDDVGPVAGALLVEWARTWACHAVVVPGADVSFAAVWGRCVEAIHAVGLDEVEVLAREDDGELLALLAEDGFVPGEQSWNTWMGADDRPEVTDLPAGFMLVDRERRDAGPHPMRRRNGEAVATRLQQCSLYDPGLDLSVEADDGQVAGYALFWFDPVTEVGLVEPMRVEDEFQRRGLARALLAEGLDRLAERGARRLKVGFGTAAARGLYLGAGFRVTSSNRSYRRSASGAEQLV
jgi:ribosomal protein S18 acetylase RimI-like enzyme